VVPAPRVPLQGGLYLECGSTANQAAQPLSRAGVDFAGAFVNEAGKSCLEEDMKMIMDEQEYFRQLNAAIEELGMVQKEFILQKNGVSSLMRFIKNSDGEGTTLSLRDPLMQKGKMAANAVIEQMAEIRHSIAFISPPEVWAPFHRVMLESFELQLKGYREMLKVFEDSDIRHIGRGKDIVKKALAHLQGGTHVIQG